MSEKTIKNPHDRFFKTTFARHETALSFLQNYLPNEIVQVFDFSSFEISKDTFIDPELRESYSDILYKVGLHSGGQSCIYVLFEHKSYRDKMVALQLIKYMANVWTLQRQQHEDAKIKLEYPLKPILPLVVYHRPTGWNVDLSFAGLFDPVDLPDVLRPYIPNFNYWLCNLSQYSDENIKGEVILRLAVYLLKYIMRDDLKEALGRIFPLLEEIAKKETGLEYVEAVLRYLTAGTDKVTEPELNKLLTEAYVEGEDIMQTIAQTWIDQGKKIGEKRGEKRGVKIGERRGEKRGERKATIEALQQTLTIRFGVGLKKFNESLKQLELKSLKQLNEEALKVNTLADFEKTLTDMPRKKQDKVAENKPKPDENETSA